MTTTTGLYTQGWSWNSSSSSSSDDWLTLAGRQTSKQARAETANRILRAREASTVKASLLLHLGLSVSSSSKLTDCELLWEGVHRGCSRVLLNARAAMISKEQHKLIPFKHTHTKRQRVESNQDRNRGTSGPSLSWSPVVNDDAESMGLKEDKNFALFWENVCLMQSANARACLPMRQCWLHLSGQGERGCGREWERLCCCCLGSQAEGMHLTHWIQPAFRCWWRKKWGNKSGGKTVNWQRLIEGCWNKQRKNCKK